VGLLKAEAQLQNSDYINKSLKALGEYPQSPRMYKARTAIVYPELWLAVAGTGSLAGGPRIIF